MEERKKQETPMSVSASLSLLSTNLYGAEVHPVLVDAPGQEGSQELVGDDGSHAPDPVRETETVIQQVNLLSSLESSRLNTCPQSCTSIDECPQWALSHTRGSATCEVARQTWAKCTQVLS